MALPVAIRKLKVAVTIKTKIHVRFIRNSLSATERKQRIQFLNDFPVTGNSRIRRRSSLILHEVWFIQFSGELQYEVKRERKKCCCKTEANENGEDVVGVGMRRRQGHTTSREMWKTKKKKKSGTFYGFVQQSEHNFRNFYYEECLFAVNLHLIVVGSVCATFFAVNINNYANWYFTWIAMDENCRFPSVQFSSQAYSRTNQ